MRESTELERSLHKAVSYWRENPEAMLGIEPDGGIWVGNGPDDPERHVYTSGVRDSVEAFRELVDRARMTGVFAELEVAEPSGRSPVASFGTAQVVCDDGSVWTWSERKKEWRELAPIPGTRRARES